MKVLVLCSVVSLTRSLADQQITEGKRMIRILLRYLISPRHHEDKDILVIEDKDEQTEEVIEDEQTEEVIILYFSRQRR